MFVGDPSFGTTLEPQVAHANQADVLREILGITDRADIVTWMTNNKTEAALRILESQQDVTMPDYINEAVAFLLPAQ
jgi:hypothetical protein